MRGVLQSHRHVAGDNEMTSPPNILAVLGLALGAIFGMARDDADESSRTKTAPR